MGSNPMTSVLIRRREELDRERGRQRPGGGGGGEADSAPSQGCLEPPETGRSKEGLFLRDPEGILETC